MARKKVCVSFETTSARLGISIFDLSTQKLMQDVFKETGPQQSELLIPELERLLKKLRLVKDNISLLAVDVGPGSFTGVRVGVAASRGLAQALKIPLIGVSSLEAMARSIPDVEGQTVVACMPALQGEIYYAAFRNLKGRLRPTQTPVWKPSEDLECFLKEFPPASNVVVIVESWRNDLVDMKKRLAQHHWLTRPVSPHSFAVGSVAMELFRTSPKKYFYEKVVPMYLQPSWAERKRNAVVNTK